MRKQLKIIPQKLLVKKEEVKRLLEQNKANQELINTHTSENEYQMHVYDSNMKALVDVRNIMTSMALKIDAFEAMFFKCKVSEKSEASIDDGIRAIEQLEFKVKAMDDQKLQIDKMLSFNSKKQSEIIEEMEQTIVKVQQELDTEKAIISELREEECELDNQLKEADKTNRELLTTIQDGGDKNLDLTKKEVELGEDIAKEKLYYSTEIEKKTKALQRINTRYEFVLVT